jgi:outer membrane protein OmpA-like peptidoglycan-associated protein
MRILITGSLVFLLWACFASWLYVSKIKPSFEKPAEPLAVIDSSKINPSPPIVVEIQKPETLVLNFDYNKSEINPSTENDQHSELFRDWLEKHSEAMLNITGHTDSRGSKTYNQSLGAKRAENIKKYLTAKGISPEKMNCLSNGETTPVSDNATVEGRSKNRRAEITLK